MLFSIRLFGIAPKLRNLQMKITKRFGVAAGALINSMDLVQSHFLGGIISKQFSMLLAPVERASINVEAGFLRIIIVHTTNFTYTFNWLKMQEVGLKNS